MICISLYACSLAIKLCMTQKRIVHLRKSGSQAQRRTPSREQKSLLRERGGCWGPASAESRHILRMDDVGEWRKIDKEIKKETRGDQSSSSEAPYFILLWAFIPWVIHTARWKMQSQLNTPSVITFIDIRVLPAKVFFCTSSSILEACWYSMTSFW